MISPDVKIDSSKVAEVLAGLLRQTYGTDVEIVTRVATITVARGKRAAQIQVLDDQRFLVSLRHNQTFRMEPAPVDRDRMAELVREMVGTRAAPPVA